MKLEQVINWFYTASIEDRRKFLEAIQGDPLNESNYAINIYICGY